MRFHLTQLILPINLIQSADPFKQLVFFLLGWPIYSSTEFVIDKNHKGSTINDLGGAGGKIKNGFIFSAGMPFENYFFLEKAS